MTADTRIDRKPRLPAEFRTPEPAWAALCFAYSFVLYFGFGYLTYYAVVQASWPLLVKVPVATLSALLASNGLHLLGWLAHEGIHLSMVKDKTLNMLLGAFAGSVFFFPSVGLGISHWPHHRFTNQPRDPDTVLQAKQQTFLSRLLLARPLSNRAYLQNNLAVLLRRPLDESWRLPFSGRALQRFSAISFGFMALWLVFYVLVGLRDLEYVLYAFAVPFLLLVPTTGLRPYLEHAGTGTGDFKDARSYRSPFYTALLFGNNYHLEHHLYPNVPSYKLPRVHRWLEAQGYFERHRSPIVDGVVAPLRYTSKRYPYPDSGRHRRPPAAARVPSAQESA